MRTPTVPRSLFVVGLILTAILVCAVVVALLYLPWICAATSPQLFGFRKVERNLYVERGYSEAYGGQVINLVAAARSRVAIYFGK